ncbi:Hypothetical predicted protein, partial [Mytilus galloprovincialis]
FQAAKPNKYDKKDCKIILTCKASGNPKPTYKDDDTRCIIAVTNPYIIDYVVQNNSGLYICEAYNTTDGIIYKAINSVEIEI